MKCDYAKLFIHDYIDDYLANEQRKIITTHIKECAECAETVNQYKQQKINLSFLATPALNLNTERMIINATNTATKSSRIVSRIPLSIAASLTILIALGATFFNNNIATNVIDKSLISGTHGITSLQKNFNLVFNSPRALDNVTFTIILPDQTELAGYPGEKKVEWTAQLTQGRNILTLPIISTNENSNEIIITRINYAQNTKVFEIKLNTPKEKQFT